MRRRDFITLLGGAAATWPLAARAQQPVMPVICYLHSASPEPYSPMIAAFRQGLAEAGYVDGQNVTIDYRWAEGPFNRLPALAAELVARRPAILVAGGGDVSAVAAKAATTTVPIVFTIGADPVGSGLVSNLSRPSGNLTGVTFFTITLGPKRLELLRELLPKAGKIAMLVNPKSLNPDAKEVQEAAHALGQSVHVLEAASEGDVDMAFRSLAQERDDALIVVSNPLFTSRREQIVALANYHRVSGDLPSARIRRFGRTRQLRRQHQGCLPSVGSLRGSPSEGRQALRSTGAAANKIRTGDQPQDRQDARPPNPG
jgi:putative tryptophan/tyrosine transport system substrate-binding protein